MPVYTYGRIAKLHAALLAAGIDAQAVERIMEGGESVVPATKPEAKAAWLQGAMVRLDALLDPQKRQSVREKCACCLGGRRLKAAKEIARAGGSFQEKVEAFDKSGIGGRVTLQEDGSIVSKFFEGQGPYRCPCLPQAKEPLSITYCQCCGGHLKHHMQIALGRKLSVRVRSSVLESGGSRPCVFDVTVDE